MKIHHLFAVVVFLGCIAVASFTSSTTVGIAIVCAGAFVAAIFLLYPTIDKLADRKGSGQLGFSPATGVTLKWEVRSDQPIRTVFPEQPTDSTSNDQARKLCNEGRELVKAKRPDKNVDLSQALAKFKDAANLDSHYWEPRINIAQILLLTGYLKEAFSEAEGVRLVFSDFPLAFAKSGLIMARVVEQSISSDDPEEERKAQYRLIVKILRENVNKCPGHITSMISLGRALLLAGASTDEMKVFLSEAMQFQDFEKEFRKSLVREDMLSNFSSQFPGFFREDSANEC